MYQNKPFTMNKLGLQIKYRYNIQFKNIIIIEFQLERL